MPTLAEVVYGLVVVVLVAGVSAASGAVASLAFHTLAARGERRRFSDLIEPVKGEIGDLWDQLDSFRKRAARRARDEKNASGDPRIDDQLELDTETPPKTPEERAARLARLRGLM